MSTSATHTLADFDGDQRDQRSYAYWCTLWLTEANNYMSGCTSGNCAGIGNFPVWQASSSDLVMTVSCSFPTQGDGCWDHDVSVGSFTYTNQRIPANSLPGCTDTDLLTCGDANWSIVQPDGTVRSSELALLRAAGVEVVTVDLDRLRDSNPAYSSL